MDLNALSMNEVSQLLTTIANSGIVNTTFNKVNMIKTSKESKERESKYEEIINELISENQQLLSIAQTYRSEYNRVNISDEDIQQLRNTVQRIINLFKKDIPEEELEGVERLIDLIQVDTLKTMQLLGFNYSEAIGKPLTEICSKKIKNYFNFQIINLEE